MQYIAEYCKILQCSTIRLSTQSKHASTILKNFSTVTHNTHVDDTKHQLNTLNAILAIIAMSLLAVIHNSVFQYCSTLILLHLDL